MDHQPIVEDLINDPLRPDAHPVGVVLTGWLSAAGRVWDVPVEIDGGADPLLFLMGQSGEGLDRSSKNCPDCNIRVRDREGR